MFVHSRSIHQSDLESFGVGMEVDFIELESQRSLEAKDVRIVNKANSIKNTCQIKYFQ